MFRSIVLTLTLPVIVAATLPQQGPVPETKPEQQKQPAASGAEPDAKAGGKKETSSQEKPGGGGALPATPPIPEQKPAQGGETPADGRSPEKPSATTDASPETPAPDGKSAATPASPPPPPIEKEDPAELQACLAELKTLGASFEPLPRIDGEEPGCGIESPIRLESPLAGIKLSEPATMRCETALTLSHWLKETAKPALEVAKPGRKITVVNNAPGYSCRLRNNAETGKISEHARGNAVDIAGFTFNDGEKLIMTPKEQDPTMDGALQRTLTAGACLHFSTVLSPGSDASHKDHLHLDVLDRKKGYRFCR